MPATFGLGIIKQHVVNFVVLAVMLLFLTSMFIILLLWLFLQIKRCFAGSSNDGILTDTIRVSNLPEDVTMLQLVEQFGVIGTVKVDTFVMAVVIIRVKKLCFFIMMIFVHFSKLLLSVISK